MALTTYERRLAKLEVQRQVSDESDSVVTLPPQSTAFLREVVRKLHEMGAFNPLHDACWSPTMRALARLLRRLAAETDADAEQERQETTA